MENSKYIKMKINTILNVGKRTKDCLIICSKISSFFILQYQPSRKGQKKEGKEKKGRKDKTPYFHMIKMMDRALSNRSTVSVLVKKGGTPFCNVCFLAVQCPVLKFRYKKR
jgi:hypothetical protein